MSTLTGKTLFFTTSPRTPTKMIPEIKLLVENFLGKKFDVQNQIEFMKILINDDTFEIRIPPKDLAFSARDRITRAPKSLGFVHLNPITLTSAGKEFIYSKNSSEALLRQLLKFQLPSPYHKISSTNNQSFWVKPYLEIIRMVYELQTLSFDELMIFGMQLTDYRNYNDIINKIKKFRLLKEKNKGKYSSLLSEVVFEEINSIYNEEINQGNLKTRESQDKSLTKFILTKKRNLRDYADACVRYLRETGIISISVRGKTLSITKNRLKEVEFILTTTERNPVYINNLKAYQEYLADSTIPTLLSDNKIELINSIYNLDSSLNKEMLSSLSLSELKDTKIEILAKYKDAIISNETSQIKQRDQETYKDILKLYDELSSDQLYDKPLMFEYNTWRAMSFINGGKITGYFKRDDDGNPMSTASGNTADIIGDYDDFNVTVEVTLQSGQRQYETEGESVSRHLAKVKRETSKDSYCIFIAPKVNESCIAHFYALHKMNIAFYGGKSVIIPTDLDTFKKMITKSYKAPKKPTKQQFKKIFEHSQAVANSSTDEIQWYKELQTSLINWTEL